MLTNTPKQHIFNFVSEINIFKKTFKFLRGTMQLFCAENAVKHQPTNQPPTNQQTLVL